MIPTLSPKGNVLVWTILVFAESFAFQTSYTLIPFIFFFVAVPHILNRNFKISPFIRKWHWRLYMKKSLISVVASLKNNVYAFPMIVRLEFMDEREYIMRKTDDFMKWLDKPEGYEDEEQHRQNIIDLLPKN